MNALNLFTTWNKKIKLKKTYKTKHTYSQCEAALQLSFCEHILPSVYGEQVKTLQQNPLDELNKIENISVNLSES